MQSKADILQLLLWTSPMWKITDLFFRFVNQIALQEDIKSTEQATASRTTLWSSSLLRASPESFAAPAMA